MSELLYRFWAPADRQLTDGDVVTLHAGLPVAADPRQATRNWADEGIVAIWCDEACAEIPAGARFTVAGVDTVVHHSASALDLELPLLVLVADGTRVDGPTTAAALLVRLALASGETVLDGRDYATPLPR